MEHIKRILQDRISKKIEPNKVLLIFGARRSGKTVLLRQVVNNFRGQTLLLNGEDYDTLSIFENHRTNNYLSFLVGVDLLAIDEAQHIPNIGSKIKWILDEVKNIRIILSGSSSFDLVNQRGEALVEKSAQFYVSPFSQKELSQIETLQQTNQHLEARLIYGSYPEVVYIDDPVRKIDYLRDITGAFLFKDLLTVESIKNANYMMELLRLIAAQIGTDISLDELGRQLKKSKNTVEKYLELLSKLFIIHRLGAYSNNHRKEVTKVGKWYFYDNGIRNALVGNFDPLVIRKDVDILWKNYLISERLKANYNECLGKEFYFWRTYDKQEVDLVEESSNPLFALQFNWGNKSSIMPKSFNEIYPHVEYKVVNRDNYLDYIT
ncbi:MAG: ATP-binding protein [Candidatus Azobacteroides sp.]|nr:ATP-binding protein [Candidatus Azobacteroides sp.]